MPRNESLDTTLARLGTLAGRAWLEQNRQTVITVALVGGAVLGLGVALKVVGVYDATQVGVQRMMNEGVDNTPAQNILFMTYMDFDDLNAGATTRKSFAEQVLADEATQVINQGPRLECPVEGNRIHAGHIGESRRHLGDGHGLPPSISRKLIMLENP